MLSVRGPPTLLRASFKSARMLKSCAAKRGSNVPARSQADTRFQASDLGLAYGTGNPNPEPLHMRLKG
jgi:hypothetical protein